MTKGELQAYVMIKGALDSLIYRVEDYCRCYKCGEELLRECKDAERALAEAKVLYNKGKRKK